MPDDTQRQEQVRGLLDGSIPQTAALLQRDMVVGWHGPAGRVPPGWAIIGQGRFMRGATVDGDVAATGGADTINIDHNHANAITTKPGAGGSADDLGTAQSGSGKNVEGENHTHSVDLPALGTTSVASLPSYYGIYWIRRTI